MPEHGFRVMGSIADVGELTQTKQYETTSARSTKSKNTSDCAKQSQSYITPPSKILLSKPDGSLIGGNDKEINVKSLRGTTKVPMSIKIISVRCEYQPNLTILYSSNVINGRERMDTNLSLFAITRKWINNDQIIRSNFI